MSETTFDTTPGAARITAERSRQIREEGYRDRHDDTHDESQLLEAAECYLVYGGYQAQGLLADPDSELPPWPWDGGFKPSHDPVRNLEKAGALIAAEIDRLLRQRQEDDDG